MRKFIGIIECLLFFISVILQGQEKSLFGRNIQPYSENPETEIIRCATVEYELFIQNSDKSRVSNKRFEEWLAPKINQMKKSSHSEKVTENPIIIPIVVHIIHKGTSVGTGANISDARVISQITVLNQDYRKMTGTPGHNDNPVGADMGIEFRLAQTDPNGNLTNGINRVNLGDYIWNESNIENILKPRTQWNPEKYFNIWVCEFGGDLSSTLGYAQFPASSGLSGLEGSYTAGRDGIIIDWRAFGSSDMEPGEYKSLYNKGRTLTHEMGHALGLRHIWGDNNSCTVDATDSYNDYCPDTPAASQANYYCNILYDSCPLDPGNDMTENYMDYTQDTCMNTFTQDQKTRILTVLQNSPRRASLTTSNTWKEPEIKESEMYYAPNPARDELKIAFKNIDVYVYKYKVYDPIGLLIESGKPDNKTEFTVNTSRYTQGVYTMVLSTNKGTKKFRFFVVK